MKRSNISLLALCGLFLCLQSCREGGDSASKSAGKASPKSETPVKDNKLTADQIKEEKDLILGWLGSRKDLSIYRGILTSAASAFPMIYDDSRFRISLFIPDDQAFGKLSADQKNKLTNEILEDFELDIFNNSMVRTIDFTWSGASNLSGATVSFSSDNKKVALNGKSLVILESKTISPRTRAYIVDGPLK